MISLEVLHSDSTASLSPGRIIDGDVEDFQYSLRPFPETNPAHAVRPSKLLRNYYRRQLSFKEDVVNAVIGAVNAFEGLSITDQQMYATHFYGVPMFWGPELRENTPTRSFMTHMAWLDFADNPISPFFDTTTNLFPSWSWASIKAQQSSTKLGLLNLLLAQEVSVHHQEDMHVWLVAHTGHRVNLNDYASQSSRHEQFQQNIFVTSWAIDCRLQKGEEKNGEAGAFSLSGFSRGRLHVDYLDQAPNEDVIVFFLGAGTSAEDDALHEGLVAFSIVGKTGTSTYRRVGLYYDWFAVGNDLQAYLDVLRPNRDWELRELQLI